MKELLFQSNGDKVRMFYERGSAREKSFEVSLQVQSLGFSGEQSQVHFFEKDYEEFLSALRDLDRTRQGRARLEFASSNEFWLEILSVDKLGHIQFQGKITQESSVRSERLWNSIGFDIELDPSTFPAVVRKFEGFARK